MIKTLYQKLRRDLNELEGDGLRRAEINNLLQSTEMAISSIEELENDLLEIRKRVKELEQNPEYAGNHEQFKPTKDE